MMSTAVQTDKQAGSATRTTRSHPTSPLPVENSAAVICTVCAGADLLCPSLDPALGNADLVVRHPGHHGGSRRSR